MQHPEDVHALCAKCKTATDNWEIAANKLWEVSHRCEGCKSATDMKLLGKEIKDAI